MNWYVFRQVRVTKIRTKIVTLQAVSNAKRSSKVKQTVRWTSKQKMELNVQSKVIAPEVPNQSQSYFIISVM